jgi:hypothetical protein
VVEFVGFGAEGHLHFRSDGSGGVSIRIGAYFLALEVVASKMVSPTVIRTTNSYENFSCSD